MDVEYHEGSCVDIEKWEATRAKGKARFIWEIGFCLWGLLTALMWSITMEIADPSTPIWLRPLIAFIGFPLGGLGVACFMWETSEAEYKKIKSLSDS